MMELDKYVLIVPKKKKKLNIDYYSLPTVIWNADGIMLIMGSVVSVPPLLFKIHHLVPFLFWL